MESYSRSTLENGFSRFTSCLRGPSKLLFIPAIWSLRQMRGTPLVGWATLSSSICHSVFRVWWASAKGFWYGVSSPTCSSPLSAARMPSPSASPQPLHPLPTTFSPHCAKCTIHLLGVVRWRWGVGDCLLLQSVRPSAR